MVSAKNVSIDNVTSEQIGKCSKHFEGSTPVYMVESESDSLVEYKVRWNAKQGFTCTCEAGQNGFSKCKAGYCKHVAWAVAASREERQAVAELQAAIALDAQVRKAMSDPETVKRAELAREEAPVKPVQKVKRTRANAPYQAKAFSILR